MPQQNAPLLAFNRGIISPLALARTDLQRTGLSAEEQTNWMPRVLGSMMLRPGLGYKGATKGNAAARHIPFVFATNDTAALELTDQKIRVLLDDVAITRTAVTSAVTNGTFNGNISGWNDLDESGATSQWVTGGYMGLTGTRYNAAIMTQEVTVNEPGTEHAIRIIVASGPVTLRIGSSSGDDDYVHEATLRTGEFSLAFTPTGNFFIHLSNRNQYQVLVDSVAVEGAGDVEIDAPWLEADLGLIRWDQSADVIYVACSGYQQQRIERYSTRSWGIATYLTEDGPFRLENTSRIQLTPSATTGDIVLTSSSALFRQGHEGALFQLTSVGQYVAIGANGDNQWSDPVRVTGVGGSRQFTVTVAGVWMATQVTLQRSVGVIGSWEYTGTIYTTNGTYTVSDGQDNQIIYYRVGIDTGAYISGTADLAMYYSAGGITGNVLITDYSSPTSALARVITPLGASTATELWSEGDWSDYRGWPSAVRFFDGRLWWFGKGKEWGSVSDAYESFDPDTEGDSAPINRSIGQGPVDTINWGLDLQRLVVGTASAEWVARSSSLDEPLTPSNFNLKAPSTRGSSKVQALKIDNTGIFTRGSKIIQLSFQGDTSSVDFTSEELTIIAPHVGLGGFKRIAVQRNPDTRIHGVRNDGQVVVLIFDQAENVKCFVMVETDGFVEDVYVLPAGETEDEDEVTYVVRREIGSGTVRYRERWALESECVGGIINKQLDSFITYSGSATNVITGLEHQEGKNVVVWADGVDLSPGYGDDQTTYTVSGGQITLASGVAVSEAIIGLPYTGWYKGTKLAYAAALGTALTQKKRVNYLGLITANMHARGLRFGPDEDNLDELPLEEDGHGVDGNKIWQQYDKDAVEFPGEWDTDSRICLEAQAPRPVTVLAAVATINTNDKI